MAGRPRNAYILIDFGWLPSSSSTRSVAERICGYLWLFYAAHFAHFHSYFFALPLRFLCKYSAYRPSGGLLPLPFAASGLLTVARHSTANPNSESYFRFVLFERKRKTAKRYVSECCNSFLSRVYSGPWPRQDETWALCICVRRCLNFLHHLLHSHEIFTRK